MNNPDQLVDAWIRHREVLNDLREFRTSWSPTKEYPADVRTEAGRLGYDFGGYLLDRVPVAAPRDGFEATLQAARRAAVAWREGRKPDQDDYLEFMFVFATADPASRRSPFKDRTALGRLVDRLRARLEGG